MRSHVPSKADLCAEVPEELVCLLGVEGLSGRELDVELVLELLDHVEPLPRAGKVNLVLLLALSLSLGVVDDLCLALVEVLDHALDEGLGHLHQVKHVGVRHVELADRELGVVGEINLLVSEHASDLVHSVEPSDDELLEVELGCDSEEQVLLEVVVVGDERLGGRSSGKRGHHRRLDLEGHERACEQVSPPSLWRASPRSETVY